jgi:hypothetical protein
VAEEYGILDHPTSAQIGIHRADVPVVRITGPSQPRLTPTEAVANSINLGLL